MDSAKEDSKSFIKSKWIAQQMKGRSEEFTVLSNIKIMCGTWNVNSKKPAFDDDLLDWLHKDGGEEPDIFCVGFQEIVSLNAVNIVADGKSRERSTFWIETILSSINTIGGDRYVLVHQQHLVGIMICVFTKEVHLPHIKRVQSQTAGVGVMGMMGNKGGAAIRFNFHDTSICVVCAHLNQSRGNVGGLNSDFLNVLKRVQFVHEELTMSELDEYDEIAKLIEIEEDIQFGREINQQGQRIYNIMNHNIVIVFGDFNSESQEGLSSEEVFEKVMSKQLDFLRERDQLNVEREHGKVFQGFSEGLGGVCPPFEPTYKFVPNTSLYDKRGKKFTPPAWCDRILWHSKNVGHMSQLSYYAAFQLEISSHKPVAALFEVKCEKVNIEEKKEVYGDVIRLLNRWETDSLPKIELETDTINFGPVRYMIDSRKSVWISNTGQTIAHWRFTPKMEGDKLHKPWLRVEPNYGMLIPGEKAEIVICAVIDNATAVDFGTGRDTGDDTLMLHLENGRDYFIDVSVEYMQSCFGATLDELVSIGLKPMRYAPPSSLSVENMTMATAANRNISTPQIVHSPSSLSVPKELWRLVDAIYQQGLQHRGLFLVQGNPLEVERIRESLDTGAHFEPCSVHSLIDALFKFLSSLAEPVICIESLDLNHELKSQEIEAWSMKLLEKLPPVNFNVLVFVISFFREVLLHSELNGLTSSKIAVLCCRCMMGTKKEEMSDHSAQQRRLVQLIINHFLTTTTI